MESIKAYLSIISPHLLMHITGKPKYFIDEFRRQIYLSEEAFFQKVCSNNQDRNYYRELKSRTKKILQALVVVSTPKGENRVKKKFDFCQRNFLVGQKMLNKGQRTEGIRLIKQAYQTAVEYNFVYMACELSSILFHDHVYYHKNKGKAKFYEQEVDKYLKAYTAEKQSEKYFFHVVAQMSRSGSPELLKNAIHQIIQLNGNSLKYQVYVATLNILYGFDTRNFRLVIESCDRAIQYFKDQKGVYNSHYQTFWSKRGKALMALSQNSEAAISFETAQQYTKPKSLNDYLIRLYKTFNALQAGEYKSAFELYLQNKRCPVKPIREQFAIIEAYLCFLAQLGYLQLDKPFRLGRYLNETFKAQMDKQGDNINILIAELLVLLARNQGKFIDRIEMVKHYSYRYLKDKNTQRAKWFIKILCLLPSVNFHPIALKRKAKRYIDLLEEHPVPLGENFTVEIIPFDDLLGMIMRQLERRVA